MKKTIFSIVFVASIIAFTNAFSQGIGLGLKAGANFANQSITDISTNSRTGFSGGAYLVLAFSEKLAIQPEFLFSSQGAEIPDLNEISQLDYLTIPLLLRWKPVSALSIDAGPQFSSLLSAVDKSGEDIKEDFKNSDLGLALGATAHLPLGLNAGLRYVWGFTNVGDFQEDTEVKNRVVQVFVGWTIVGAK